MAEREPPDREPAQSDERAAETVAEAEPATRRAAPADRVVDDVRAPRPGTIGAAFFDLDRTLMAGSSAFEFVRSAHRAGYVTRRELARDAIKNVDFRLRGSTDEAMEAVRVRVAEMIGGVAVRDLLRLAPDVIAGILPRVSRTMLDVAWNHQDAGRRVYICTAASQGVVELLAPVLRFDGAVGTDYEVRDGVYTGGLAGPLNYGEGKATSIRDLAARESIDLDASFAYSDSASDLPMLRAVAYPVAVNPDRELGAIAREEGWEVLRFDRLEAKLKLGAAVLTTAALGSTGRVVVQRRRHRTGPARALRLPRR